MLKREAREILGMEDDGTWAVARPRLRHLRVPAAMLHERGELRTDFRAVNNTVPYHAPCQQRGHGIGTPALDLMGLVPELPATEVDATCCGVAGTYGLKREKYDIAMAVGAAAVRAGARLGRASCRCATRRPAAGGSPTPPGARRSTRSRCCTAPTGSADPASRP